MFDKLFQAQQKAEEIKKRLDTISVSGEAEGGLIRVVATANKEIKEITIDPVFLSNADKEELEELLVVALNKAIVQAENISQAEMQAASKDMLGGLGGLFNQ
ncbi:MULTISPECIES: YbaB/EbfC family nucleoid-associated protein [Sphingobacterium]|jgi:DNA-binding YbaB/EbfC family protein|uniref:YbaB/EbfC family nucleoid-associated protein n=1 Tax=Sphingobacterium TaxID=28453 RepID=UPI000CE9F0D5|nr:MULTISPECIES: YbaB/EbfC family nucleoid-associated protein [Sphingobacterium]MDF2477871.1 nucleoid-associated protein YbaB/EbfC family [Sphingobacterium sp.]MDR2273764.1 YbaB/EbfC family nucleoid-associated protein [Sphingobacterium sp.]NPE47878.1 YbaB/EbfC family nucleoid-associated protein [Sphingobacterium prati]